MAARKPSKKPFHESVAERLIQQLKEGTAPWQRPWIPGEGSMPMNPTTGKRYKGINAIFLLAQGRGDPRWMTYKQAAAAGAQVRKGEKGTPVQYWKFTEQQTKLDDNGKPVLDNDGHPVKVSVALERPRVFFATVFNGEQIDGLPALARKPVQWDAHERAEHILSASGATIRHAEGNRAFYRPATDSIHLPDKGQFPTSDNYYATALHELGHWTGHPSRLDRDLAHPFGSEGYAREELRAEIASMLVGEALRIGHDPGQHAAYVQSWIKVLEDDPMEIFRASADAEKMHEFVLAFEQKQVQKHDQQQEASVHNIPSTESDTLRAEAWTLHHVQNATLDNALQTASLEQIDRVIDTIDRMQPLNTENAFWSNHGLPQDIGALDAKIDAAADYLIETRRPDAVLSVAFLNLKNGDADSYENDRETFRLASENSLGFALPENWTGQIHIAGVIRENGALREANLVEETPDAYQLYARKHTGPDAATYLTTVDDLILANNLADRLAVIHAHAETNPYEKTARLARLNEACVQRDPNSTDEDLSAAKETRKAAEVAAMLNDGELQRAIAAHEQQQNTADLAAPQGPVRTYINVPYREKDEARSLGARWDRQKQSWYVPPGVNNDLFSKWTQQASQSAAQRRLYLAVPYGERGAAKAAGAKWDKAAKSWYAGPGADMDKLQRWLPENVQDQQSPAMTPREEFAEALTSLGCVLTGDHPMMDGQKHRIGVEGDRKGEQAGFYVGHLDGHPAGYIKNNRTGIDMKWKSKGYSLDSQEKAKLQAEAAVKLAARQAERDRQQEATAQRVTLQMDNLVPVSVPTPYMLAKGIQPHAGAMTDAEGQKTYIPATDADGRQWTMQYIQEDGTKRFAKDSRKEGCFHAVGGIGAIAVAPVLVISEGYATAATLAEALGHGTIAAFDAGNLPAVARVLHGKFPDKPVVIAGDDDRHLEATQGINPGKVKALEAAKAAGGKAIFPVFAPGEAAYPASLDPITPKRYRDHQRVSKTLEDQPALSASAKEALRLSLIGADQLAALDKMKQHTDFNDLATRSELGQAGVVRQVSTSVAQVIDTAPRTFTFDSLSPDNQERAKARFMNAGEKDGYRYALGRDGQVLSRRKEAPLKRSQQQDAQQRRSARI